MNELEKENEGLRRQVEDLSTQMVKALELIESMLNKEVG